MPSGAVRAYISLLIVAELIIATGSASIGLLLHTVGLIILISDGLNTELRAYRPDRQDDAYRATTSVMSALALAPLLRIFSFSMPIAPVTHVYWNIIVAMPLVVAVMVFIGVHRTILRETALALRRWRVQLLVALLGLPAGLVVYAFLSPGDLASPGGDTTLRIGVVSGVLVVAAVLEEIIFRALIQPLTERILGISAVLWTSFLWASTYASNGIIMNVAWFAFLGIVLGIAVRRTGSVWGAAGAHSLMNVSAVAIWPVLLGDIGQIMPPGLRQWGALIVEITLVIAVIAIVLMFRRLANHPPPTSTGHGRRSTSAGEQPAGWRGWILDTGRTIVHGREMVSHERGQIAGKR